MIQGARQTGKTYIVERFAERKTMKEIVEIKFQTDTFCDGYFFR